MTLHYSTIDGWHMKQFLNDLQNSMNNPLEWLYYSSIYMSYLIENKEVEKYFRSKNKALDSKAYDTWEIEKDESNWVDNDNIIFVLVGKAVASSAEGFVSYLKTLDNVVFVGTNTSGVQGVSEIQVLFLPNSNIYVQIGFSFDMLKDSPHFKNGVCFKPDIWLDNKDMIERLLTYVINTI